MKQSLIGLFLISQLWCLCMAGAIHSVDYVRGEFHLREGNPTSVSLAWGHFDDDILKDGWSKLYINTNDLYQDHKYSLLTHYAAGFLEGALTWSQMHDHYISWYQYTFENATYHAETVKFVHDQDAFARQLVAINPNNPFYQALGRVIAQFDGMLEGINQYATADKALNKTALLYLQGAGDMYEINPATNKKARYDWQNLTGDAFHDVRHRTISCSAMIKATDDWSDVFAGHTTWTSFQNMLRVYKYYQFSGPNPYRVSFSAKPGMIYSKDDFYVLPDSNMVVMETTNGVINQTLLDFVEPRTLLTWQRVPIANQLANNGDQWTEYFLRHNSGTYNNQYMVVDMKTVAQGKPTKGFLWISETMPLLAKRQDVTEVFINQGNYWPSYNIPFDVEVRDYAGFTAKAISGDLQSNYTECVRAKIFKRNQTNVTTLDGLKALLRYNDYKNDELSLGNPANAIASRYDLRENNANAFGAIDGKVTSKNLVPKNQAWIQSGPSHDTQTPFQWSTSKWNQRIHPGQPDTFNFTWIQVQEV